MVPIGFCDNKAPVHIQTLYLPERIEQGYILYVDRVTKDDDIIPLPMAYCRCEILHQLSRIHRYIPVLN